MSAAIVVLSAADSELAALAAAAAARGPDPPATRFANFARLDTEGAIDAFLKGIAASARLVVVRLMGGASYWPHGLDRLRAWGRGDGRALVVVPGETCWDDGLAALSTRAPDECRRMWCYLVEGGPENHRRALDYAAFLIGQGGEPAPPAQLPRAGIYWPREGAVEAEVALARIDRTRPVAAIVFYRALLDGGMLGPVDTLAAGLEAEGMTPLPVFVASLKDSECEAVVEAIFARVPPAIVLNATAFAVSGIGAESRGTVLDRPGRPVLQVVFAGSSEEDWRASARGLAAPDLTMNVAMPEIDGRILTRAVSFKATRADGVGTSYRALADRIAFVARQAAAWVRLGAMPAPGRRVALVLGNYPDRDGRIGNGVGLDTPASTVAIARAMREAGYTATGFPETSGDLMASLVSGERPTARLPLADYADFFATLPATARAAVLAQWGPPEEDPTVAEGGFPIRAHVFGNVALGVQPARGYGVDPQATLHDPDLVPPHHYLAFYAWLRRSFGAHAIVHVGKHGNLEWLPGKALGLSATCWPEIALGATPLIYPFIVNDPGEGSQAKRRGSAVIVDHLMPAMTRADLSGGLAELETLVDEYALAAPVDPRRAAHLADAIMETAARYGLDRDLGLARSGHDDALKALDAHLCDLKEMQIRDGLHTLGASPSGQPRIDTLVAIARSPRSGGRPQDESLHRAIADDLALGFDPLDARSAEAWTGPRPGPLADVSAAPWRTVGDTVERIELLAARLVELVACQPPLPVDGERALSLGEPQASLGEKGEGETDAPRPDRSSLRSARSTLSPPVRRAKASLSSRSVGHRSAAVLLWIARDLAPKLDASGNAEIAAVLAALDGRFVPPGPSGAPTRGRPDVLPTGRNFYSVDVRGMPTQAAWALGRAAADALAHRYRDDEGCWPRSIAMSAWATSNMRTGGDDIAQVLALMGAEPTWEPTTGRVTGFRVIPLAALGRARIDVTLKISGMFRDAFPGAIDLIDAAARAIAALDEHDEMNPIAAAGRGEASPFRIFGSKPGAYGAGLQAPIDEGVWDTRADLAEAFLAWGAFAYGKGVDGYGARAALLSRLAAADAVFQAQDNREHDILDSDDYYQFLGGLAATVETVRGAPPRIYFGDHARPEKPVTRSLGEEIARVVRGRAANPKWIAGMMRHGYKGAFEIAATVDYLFAFAATTDAVADHHFDALYDAYVADAAVDAFMTAANPAARSEMAERFREAIDRGLWSPRLNSAYIALSAIIDDRKEAAE